MCVQRAMWEKGHQENGKMGTKRRCGIWGQGYSGTDPDLRSPWPWPWLGLWSSSPYFEFFEYFKATTDNVRGAIIWAKMFVFWIKLNFQWKRDLICRFVFSIWFLHLRSTLNCEKNQRNSFFQHFCVDLPKLPTDQWSRSIWLRSTNHYHLIPMDSAWLSCKAYPLISICGSQHFKHSPWVDTSSRR